jgi:hypothetical protein
VGTEESSATGSQALGSIGMRRIRRESAGYELMAQYGGVEKPHSMDLASTPVILIDTPEGLDLPNQRPRMLIFLCVN